MHLTDLLAGVIVFIAYGLSTVTGFGANLIGLPLMALVVGLVPGKQALVVQGVVLYTYITARSRRKIDLRQLTIILAVAGAGLVVGMAAFEFLPRRGSEITLSLFVIAVGLRGVLNLAPDFRAPAWLARAMLFLGGVVHGSFTTGGPLLVIYCRRAMPHKSTFRATLAVMWLALAIGLCVGWTVSGAWHPLTPRVFVIGLPFLAAGMVAGEYVHHR